MNKIKRLFAALKNRGIIYVIAKLPERIFKTQKPPGIENYTLLKQTLKGKAGIEIGGPSAIFGEGSLVPVYHIIGSLDGCNFSTKTIWEGNINSGETFNYYKNKTGTQYICEATDLRIIPNSMYDFVISSNCLEHVANPLKALNEWLRIIKSRGVILLILPNKNFCFDHNRPVTTFSHLLSDLQNDTKEDDMTHLDEILRLHDLSMDLPAGTPEQFKARSLKNFENRALHQHVFDIALLRQIFNYLNLEIMLTHGEGYMNVIAGRKK
jgi:SAM-dependent methyltransferase